MSIWRQGRRDGPADTEARRVAFQQPGHLEPCLQARGLARVVGKEGSRTLWMSHTKSLLPFLLSTWPGLSTRRSPNGPCSTTTMDSVRGHRLHRADDQAEPAEGGVHDERVAEAPVPRGDLSSSSLSAPRMRYESERDATRARKSSSSLTPESASHFRASCAAGCPS